MSNALAIGQKFDYDIERPFTLDGRKGIHRYTAHCIVTSTDAVTFSWAVVSVSDEQDRPPFANTPNGGTMAWVSLPRRVASGELRVS